MNRLFTSPFGYSTFEKLILCRFWRIKDAGYDLFFDEANDFRMFESEKIKRPEKLTGRP